MFVLYLSFRFNHFGFCISCYFLILVVLFSFVLTFIVWFYYSQDHLDLFVFNLGQDANLSDLDHDLASKLGATY